MYSKIGKIWSDYKPHKDVKDQVTSTVYSCVVVQVQAPIDRLFEHQILRSIIKYLQENDL